jgi:hypothetical protein
MELLTAQYGNNPAVPIGFDLDFVLSLDDATWKGIDAIIQKLHAYELTGLMPEEIKAVIAERDTLKKALELACNVLSEKDGNSMEMNSAKYVIDSESWIEYLMRKVQEQEGNHENGMG